MYLRHFLQLEGCKKAKTERFFGKVALLYKCSYKKATSILKKWGLENETIFDIYYEGSGNRNENAFYIGKDYVLKFSANLGKLKNHITISKALENAGLFAATPVKTLEGEEYIADGELYFCLSKRLEGQQIKINNMYEDDLVEKERLERKIESERSSYRYLNSRLRETEEELDRERGKSAWDKFREKHHLKLQKKRYKIPNYNKTRRREMIVRKLLFGVYV